MIWLIAIIVGFIVSWIVNYSSRRINLFAASMVGIVGALAGTWFFMYLLGIVSRSGFLNLILNIIWSIVGAGIFLAISEALSAYEYERTDVARTRPIAHEYDDTRVRRKTDWERERERLAREHRDKWER